MRVSLIAGVLASAVVVTARTDHNYHQYAFYTQGDDETTQWGLNLIMMMAMLGTPLSLLPQEPLQRNQEIVSLISLGSQWIQTRRSTPS